MTGLTSVTESWQSFWKAVGPPDASEIQKTEMRRAFYAGAWAVFCQMRRTGDDDIPEGTGVMHLMSIEAECRTFQRLVKEGKA